jgi:hypothetical protein
VSRRRLLIRGIGRRRIGRLLGMTYDERMRNARETAYADQGERPPPLETHSHHLFTWMREKRPTRTCLKALALGLDPRAKS